MFQFIKQKLKSLIGILILTVFLTSFIPAILNYIFDFYLIYHNSKKIAKEELLIHEKNIYNYLKNFFPTAKNIALTLAELLQDKNQEEIETTLAKVQQIYWDTWFHHFFIVDKTGKVIISPEYKGITHINEKLDLDFQKIKEPYITSFHFFKEADHYHPILIVPIKKKDLWLSIELNPNSFVENFSNDTNQFIQTYIIDRTNEAYLLFNGQHQVIKDFTHLILNYKENICEFSKNYRNEDVYACIYHDQENDYKIITELPTKKIFYLFKIQILRTTVVFFLLMIIIIYIIYKISKRIARPINEIVSGIEGMELEKGLVLKLEKQTGIKETDLLIQKFNILLERINGLIENIRNTSETMNKLTVFVKNLSQVTEKSSVDLSSILEENSASLEEINSNMGDIESLGNKNQESAKEIQELIQVNLQKFNELGKNLENLAEISNQTANLTKESKNQSESLKNMIYEMQESSERITEILNIIKEISDRTNLLSLNASIEAARAGESGRGFAVVAQSISNLADTTEKSVQDIEELIENTTNQMAQAIQYIDKSNEMMNKSFTMVNSLNDEIQNSKNIIKIQLEGSNKIFENANKMYSIARDTFNSIKFIKDIIREINQSIDEASRVSIQFTETSKKLNDTVETLDKVAKKLEEKIKKFIKQ
ncbi:MAG: methyl-accepting chemotaxis protein [Leptonema sp. (in: bacteria)]